MLTAMLYTLLRTHMYRWKILTPILVLVKLYVSHMMNFLHSHTDRYKHIDIYKIRWFGIWLLPEKPRITSQDAYSCSFWEIECNLIFTAFIELRWCFNLYHFKMKRLSTSSTILLIRLQCYAFRVLNNLFIFLCQYTNAQEHINSWSPQLFPQKTPINE